MSPEPTVEQVAWATMAVGEMAAFRPKLRWWQRRATLSARATQNWLATFKLAELLAKRESR